MRNGLRAAEAGDFRVPGRFETSPYETVVEAVQPSRVPCYSASRAKTPMRPVCDFPAYIVAAASASPRLSAHLCQAVRMCLIDCVYTIIFTSILHSPLRFRVMIAMSEIEICISHSLSESAISISPGALAI